MSITHEDIALVLSDSLENNQLDEALDALRGLRPVDIADALELVAPELAWGLLARLPDRAEIWLFAFKGVAGF